MEWRLEKEAVAAAEAAGMKTIRISAGDSPYSNFQLLVVPAAGWDSNIPHRFELSPISIYSSDPATSHKGRHGTGMMILATPDPDGWVKVASCDETELVLLDGTHLGKPRKVVTLGDFFPKQ